MANRGDEDRHERQQDQELEAEHENAGSACVFQRDVPFDLYNITRNM